MIFIENRFTPWSWATFEKASPKTWTGGYRTQLTNISADSALVNRKLDTNRKRTGGGLIAELGLPFSTHLSPVWSSFRRYPNSQTKF